MTKITRKDQQIFASTAGDESVAKFGSLAAGSPGYSTDPDEIQTDEYKGGWESAVIGQASPTMEDRNSLDYLFSRQLAYLYQTGIPAYSATDTYYKGSIVSFYSTEDDALKLYYSIVDDNTGNSLEDGDKWVEWKSGGGASLPLLTFQFTDHELNDVSWVKSNFSWLSGSVYLAAYKHLQADVGFRYASSTLTVSHPDFTAGTYVRISALDKTIDTTDYYAWGIGGTTEDTKCVYTLTTTLADGVKTYFYKNSAMQQLTSCIVESQSETISGTTVSYFRAQDGHKIVLEDQATNVASIYSTTGIAWYYIFDDTNTRFKLPRSNWNFKVTSNDDAGDFVDQSLPNITGTMQITANAGVSTAAPLSGAFYRKEDTLTTSANTSSSTTNPVGFNASLSSSVYQDSANVRQKSTKAYLYFFVGNFEQSAIEQTAGINAEDFQNKADIDLGNVNHDGTTQIAHFSAPSDKFLVIATGQATIDGTAPADGFMVSKGTMTSTGYSHIMIIVYQSDAPTLSDDYEVCDSRCMIYDPSNTHSLSVTVPIQKGQKYRAAYQNVNASPGSGFLRFTYAKGSEPQS